MFELTKVSAVVDWLCEDEGSSAKPPKRKVKPSVKRAVLGALIVISFFAVKNRVIFVYEWFVTQDTHTKIHAPEAVKEFRAVQDDVASVKLTVAELKSEFQDMKALQVQTLSVVAQIAAQRHVALAIPSPTPGPAPTPAPLTIELIPSAHAGQR
jgi:hypothetical protein